MANALSAWAPLNGEMQVAARLDWEADLFGLSAAEARVELERMIDAAEGRQALARRCPEARCPLPVGGPSGPTLFAEKRRA
jgi:hypothetical protein